MKTNINSPKYILNRKPIKIPDELIYSMPFRVNSDTSATKDVTVHKMADIKTGEYIGEMITRIRKNVDCTYIYPKKYRCDSLEILKIYLKIRRMGYGTKFIELAKHESLKSDCGGRIFLCATRLFDREHPSHIFYRKQGFTSVCEKMNKILDDCIAKGKDLDIAHSNDLIMYLPEKEKPGHRLSGLSKVFKLFKKFI